MSREASPPLPVEVMGWDCQWTIWGDRLELWARRQARRDTPLGSPLAGRILLQQCQDAWSIELRLWFLEDLAEHQRLRVRRALLPSIEELHDFLTDAGLSPALADAMVAAVQHLRPRTLSE